MIALHFRDNPADILRRTSIYCPGDIKYFGDLPFPLAGNPFHMTNVLMRTAPLSIHDFQFTLGVYHYHGQMSTNF